MTKITPAILAGGRGTRLRDAVPNLPKVLAPVAGRPYVTFVLDQLAFAGFREVHLLIGYSAELVQSRLRATYAGMRLHYHVEETSLGTGGALRHALPNVGSLVLVMNGDSYCDLDLADFCESHRRDRADLSIAVTRVPLATRFGRVMLDDDRRVLAFEEKSNTNEAVWINAGIYLIARRLIEEIPPNRQVSLEHQLFPQWIHTKKVYGYPTWGKFLDIGTPESYASAEAFFDTSPKR